MKLARKCIITALLCIIVSVGIASLHIGTSSASVNLPTDMPYVFVYPEEIIAEPGQNITVTVGVYNLSDNVYSSFQEWNIGQPLPPYSQYGIHRYPMGYLVGFDIKFSWDPNVLEYLNRTVTVPFESYPTPIPPLNFTGTLHQPVQPIKDALDPTLGTYQLAKAHVGVNYFNGNGTLFKMTFRVKKEGGSPLTLSNSTKLSAPPISQAIGKTYDSPGIIPNQVRSGIFLTSGAKTRVYSLDVKASVGTRTFSAPINIIIAGENGTVKITMHNYGSVTDYYNLTLYHTYPNGSIETVIEWLNQEINTTKRDQSFEVVILSSNMARGNHTFMANATILHAGEVSPDTFDKQVRVISADLHLMQRCIEMIAPLPQYVYIGEPVTFDATGSNHSEPTGNFTLYKWEFRESSTAPVRATVTNSTPIATYTFQSALNWTASLIVTDNFGITYDANRPATAAYKLDFIVEAKEKVEGGLPWDLVTLAIILIVVIVVVGYLYMRRRR